MSHWRTSRREAPTLGALNSSMLPGSPRATTRDRINKFFPSGSLLAEPVPELKRSNLAQAILDVLFVFSAFLFVTITGVGIAFAVLTLLFVNLG